MMRKTKKCKKISDIFTDYDYAHQIKSQLEREIEFNKKKSLIKTTNNDSVKSTKVLKTDDMYNNFMSKNENHFNVSFISIK